MCSAAASAKVRCAELLNGTERCLSSLRCSVDGNLVEPRSDVFKPIRPGDRAEHPGVGDSHVRPLGRGVDPVVTLEVDGYRLALREYERLAGRAILQHG